MNHTVWNIIMCFIIYILVDNLEWYFIITFSNYDRDFKAQENKRFE